MRPLAEADLSDVEGLAFDVDDTLTTRGRLTAEAFGALGRLHEAGLRLIAVTGRPLGWTDAMAATWPLHVAIGENGAGWSSLDGRALRVAYLDSEDARQQQRHTLTAVREDVRARLPEVRVSSDQPARRCDLAFDVGEAEQLSTAKIDELVATIEAHGARVTVSSVHAHAAPGTWNKARGVGAAVEDVFGARLEPARWIYVGDSGNDGPAFELFERSVGVANVREHLHRLPHPPRFVTRASRGAGFVELADAILGAR